jgi:hypothetical protein
MEGSGSCSQICVLLSSMSEEPPEEVPQGSKLAVLLMNLPVLTLL